VPRTLRANLRGQEQGICGNWGRLNKSIPYSSPKRTKSGITQKNLLVDARTRDKGSTRAIRKENVRKSYVSNLKR